MKRALFNILVEETVNVISCIISESGARQLSETEKRKIATNDVLNFFDDGENDNELIDGDIDETDTIPYLRYHQMYLDCNYPEFFSAGE